MASRNVYTVKLKSFLSNFRVEFDVVPDVSEVRNVEYKSYNPIHGASTIYSFSHSSARVFAINNARLISRTPLEASRNMAKLQVLRSWTLPYTGSTPDDLIGRPPDVLSFSAFSRGGSRTEITNPDRTDVNSFESGSPNGVALNLFQIPTVINNLQITYPSDVDYIPTEETTIRQSSPRPGDSTISIDVPGNEPFPTVMSVDIQLFETQSPSDLNRFSLTDYREGRLAGF